MTRLFDAAREGVRPLRARGVRAGRSRCSSGSWREDPGQPRRRAAPGDRALVARPRARRPRRRSSGRAAIAPRSPDVRAYLALHYARGARTGRAPCRCSSGSSPSRPTACRRSRRWRAIRERQGRPRRRARAAAAGSTRCARRARRSSSGSGELAMARSRRRVAIEAFEKARARAGRGASRTTSSWASSTWRRGGCPRRATRSTACRRRIPDYPMALFKRAQVSVLLQRARPGGADRGRARRADATTRR